jgi:D-methionine transport system substrate-binding protein
MKKSLLILLFIFSIISLAGCQEKQDDEIEVIATQTPHAEILEYAKELLEVRGYKLKVTTTSDYYFPNPAIAAKDADANFFQHIPFLELYNQNNPDYQLVVAARVHIEPMGLYANAYDNLSEIPNRAVILLSDSTADHGRALSLLEAAGLITIKSGVDIKALDFDIEEAIESNPKQLEFRTNTPPNLMISAYQNEDADLYIINSNYVLEALMNPLTDSIFIEEVDQNPYVNILAVRPDRIDDPKIQILIEILESEEMKSFIRDTYQGSVIPT